MACRHDAKPASSKATRQQELLLLVLLLITIATQGSLTTLQTHELATAQLRPTMWTLTIALR